jgi:phosphoserine phosphatase
MTDSQKIIAAMKIPTADEIKRNSEEANEKAVDEWFQLLYAQLALLIQRNSEKLARGDLLPFSVAKNVAVDMKASTQRHRLWIKHHEKVAQTLREKGYSVEIITGGPSHTDITTVEFLISIED